MLETAVVAAHVVRGPASAEFIASGGKLSYKVAQPAVEGVAAGLGAEDGNHIVGGEFPIREEPPGPFFIQEYEACVVGGPDWVDVHLGMQSKAEFVGGKDVHAGVADECRRVSNGVKGELHTWPDLLWCGSTLPLACSGGTRQIEQVRTLSLVELEGPRQCLQDALRHSRKVPAFEPGVILNAHSGEGRDFAATEPGTRRLPPDVAALPVRG
ncbi:hypothetical protein AHiyo1_34930 [Arthrobacter sp. Hiyo1]|nr:hypothetical protein AHiyo1_34930 [Arthrobacter sp. Hiyo1]